MAAWRYCNKDTRFYSSSDSDEYAVPDQRVRANAARRLEERLNAESSYGATTVIDGELKELRIDVSDDEEGEVSRIRGRQPVRRNVTIIKGRSTSERPCVGRSLPKRCYLKPATFLGRSRSADDVPSLQAPDPDRPKSADATVSASGGADDCPEHVADVGGTAADVKTDAEVGPIIEMDGDGEDGSVNVVEPISPEWVRQLQDDETTVYSEDPMFGKAAPDCDETASVCLDYHDHRAEEVPAVISNEVSPFI